MSTTPAPNHRASLLSGLRTGGVRSVSASGNVPQTAGPTVSSFQSNPLPRFASQSQRSNPVFPEEKEDSESAESVQGAHLNHHGSNALYRNAPVTAAVDGSKFSQQQGLPMNPNSAPFRPALAQSNSLQQQALQMQMMQLEILRMQAVQAQAAQTFQMQAEILAQHQRAQQAQSRRSSLQINPPASAGPLSNGFDLRSATLGAQLRRANADQLRSQLGLGMGTLTEEPLPMTAALGGKFGSRGPGTSNSAIPSRRSISVDHDDDAQSPATPNSTTVISGGTSLGKSATPVAESAPSKSDSAISWRRGGNNNSVLGGANRSVTSPALRVTPPPSERRVSPPPVANVTANTATAISPQKARPQPLRFSATSAQPVAIAIGSTNSDPTESEQDNDDDSSTVSSNKSSSPTTPHSASSNETPLSPREEATKKLYEGLGIGRPAPSSSPIPVAQVLASHRMASQPVRQPRGPPSGLDELGPKNFATRIRRKAIGGLGSLMGARERREFVEAF